MPDAPCPHIETLRDVRVAERLECDICVETGGQWLHLRTCQTCGTTRCCDQSEGRHATRHAHESGHPLIASAEPGERWVYCYLDDAFAEY